MFTGTGDIMIGMYVLAEFHSTRPLIADTILSGTVSVSKTT